MKKIKQTLKFFLITAIILTAVLSNGLYVKATGNRVNFALNKPVVGSYQDSPSHSPNNVVDGDLSTRWGTDPYGTNQWVCVDLEKNYVYDEFYIASENSEAQKIRQFKIEGSNDNNVFELIYQSDDNQSGYGLEQTIKLNEAVDYRYVKITVEKLISGAYPSVSLREFGIIGTEEERISDVKTALSKLSIPHNIYRNFKISLYDEELGVDFSWKSENDAVVIKDDTVVINSDSNEKKGTLIVEASKDGYSQNESYAFEVKSLQSGDYSIYPLVQQMNYGNDVLKINDKINVVMYPGMDESISNYLINLFKEYQIEVIFSDEKSDDALNIYLGIKDQGDLADQYLAGKVDDSSIAGTADGYVLKVCAQDNIVAIVGNDVSGTFDGVFTLKQMLASSNESLKDVTIIDSPDTKFRGIVEGFYGQYTHKERLDLLAFMGPLKMNTYVYGAKSDAYHRNKWRDLYPENNINEIKELVTKGKENNVELVWTAHVGGNIDMGSQSDFDALINKFDQLYNIGVRQFGIFYDDAYTDSTYLVEFVNKVNREYIHKRTGVKDLIICPEQYCKTRVSGNYLDLLAQFDQDVQIMWTGDSVISEVNPSMMEYIESKINRPAYIWWNYPVNDLGMGSQLLVGQTVGLSNEMGKMNGLVSNPMLQAQASKFSLFSIADYGWNIADFDKEESWNKAVEYIIPEKEYAEAFKLFAANNNQSVAELQDIAVESEYLIESLNVFREKYYSGENIETEVNNLIEEFNKIEEACLLLNEYKGNPELVSQINPWVNNLLKVVEAGQLTLNNILYLSTHDINEAVTIANVHQNFLECQDKLGNIGGQWSGRRVLLPFIYEMQDVLENTINNQMNEHIVLRTVTNYRNGNFVMMDLDKMIDGDINSYVTFDQKEVAGKWFGVDLGAKIKVNKLEILIGKDARDQDVASDYKIQISNNGIQWTDIDTTNNNNRIMNSNTFSTRFIRYYVEKGCNKNVKVREFRVDPIDKVIFTNSDKYQKIDVIEEKSIVEIGHIDNFMLANGEYIGIQFERAQEFTDLVANAELNDLKLEYSINKHDWLPFEGEKFVAKYIRLINKTGENFNGNFEYLKTVGSEIVTIEDQIEVTKSDDLVIWSGSPNDLIDDNRDTLIWTRDQKAGQNYVLDLKKEYPIKDINVVMVSGDVMKEGVVEISSNGIDWKEIGIIGEKTENLIVLENETARYIKVTVTKDSSTWLKINEIEINQLNSDTQIPILDNKQAETAIDKNLTTKFSGSNSAGKLEYNNVNTLNATTLNILKDNKSKIKVEGLFNGVWEELFQGSDAYMSIDFATMGSAERFKISWEDGSNPLFYEIATSVKEVSLNKDILIALINEAKKLQESDYVTDSWKVLSLALQEAIEILENASNQETIDLAVVELQEAIDNLVLIHIEEVDKQALQIAIDKAEVADLENVVPAVVTEFNEALENAKAVYSNEKATQEEVNNAFDRLASAMQMLEFYKGDKTALQKQVDQINNLDESKYIESSWHAMLPALDKANDVLADVNAMQEEVDEVYSELVKAFLNLRLKPNKDLLSSLISQANGLSEANYTAASWKVMNDTLNDAKAVFNDPEASQAEVDNAKDALTKAMAGLVANSDITPINLGDTTASVKTGDDVSLGMLMNIAGLSVLGLIYSKKKRENI